MLRALRTPLAQTQLRNRACLSAISPASRCLHSGGIAGGSEKEGEKGKGDRQLPEPERPSRQEPDFGDEAGYTRIAVEAVEYNVRLDSLTGKKGGSWKKKADRLKDLVASWAGKRTTVH
mmetsp:Transcript_9262/g.25201  ORF Transcript_9262/g.25201 Transcript_9262/m.25201 type:complete len:119 (+) Transcript_9262:1673-2029(+)|eukprot:CAMPEP_0113871460 /NCGR_PEP_ID=MMETSP0780_2-20120614/2658_1 /TAXON_ID=652834 /ORGANISM="Palpitomonas bilix" /LENGTH=118 /DNA_ID=CAMNT_0000856859 /DNA_START=376 /DNA_END=732 /DNA_ORIENTATION=- /assembly_acc=CAM_ASM_000599